MFLNPVVEACPQFGIRTYHSIRYRQVRRMHSVAFECFFGLQRAVEHEIYITALQSSIDLYMDVEESRYLAFQAFQTLLDSKGFLAFLCGSKVCAQTPKDNVFYHFIAV